MTPERRVPFNIGFESPNGHKALLAAGRDLIPTDGESASGNWFLVRNSGSNGAPVSSARTNDVRRETTQCMNLAAAE